MSKHKGETRTLTTPTLPRIRNRKRKTISGASSRLRKCKRNLSWEWTFAYFIQSTRVAEEFLFICIFLCINRKKGVYSFECLVRKDKITYTYIIYNYTHTYSYMRIYIKKRKQQKKWNLWIGNNFSYQGETYDIYSEKKIRTQMKELRQRLKKKYGVTFDSSKKQHFEWMKKEDTRANLTFGNLWRYLHELLKSIFIDCCCCLLLLFWACEFFLLQTFTALYLLLLLLIFALFSASFYLA